MARFLREGMHLDSLLTHYAVTWNNLGKKKGILLKENIYKICSISDIVNTCIFDLIRVLL
jgi:hypothetical protein